MKLNKRSRKKVLKELSKSWSRKVHKNFLINEVWDKKKWKLKNNIKMSANNCTLIKQHKGKFCVFSNIMAEGWGKWDENDKYINSDNELHLSSAKGCYEKLEDAVKKAQEIEDEDYTEYGVQFEQLCKDGEEVKIIE